MLRPHDGHVTVPLCGTDDNEAPQRAHVNAAAAAPARISVM
jgi:hypothetical protein